MAEALLRAHWPQHSGVSAAIQPGHLRRLTREVLAARGLPTAGLRARGLLEVDWEEVGQVIVLSERLALPPLPRRLKVEVWATPDPLTGPVSEHREASEAALDRIEARLKRLLGPPESTALRR